MLPAPSSSPSAEGSRGRGGARRGAAAGQARRRGVDVFEVEPLPPLVTAVGSVPRRAAPLPAHNADFTESYFRDGWRVWRASLRLPEGEELETPVDVSGY